LQRKKLSHEVGLAANSQVHRSAEDELRELLVYSEVVSLFNMPWKEKKGGITPRYRMQIPHDKKKRRRRNKLEIRLCSSFVARLLNSDAVNVLRFGF
jgi:hypothetical protein